jgi:hypothetical protein
MKNLPILTPLDMSDLRNNSIELYKIMKGKWMFVDCMGGLNPKLCSACRKRKVCQAQQEEEEELMNIFVHTFHERVEGVSDDDTCIPE